MMKKLLTPLIAGTFLITAVLPFTVQAGRGGGGAMAGPCLKTVSQNRDHLRLRDGSFLNSKTSRAGFGLKRGRAYGPGDCMSNTDFGPKDGTGYGARSHWRS
jgi:hypothetical protein